MLSERPMKKQLAATNKVDHFDNPEKISNVAGKLHVSGRFHAVRTETHVKRVDGRASSTLLNIFQAPPQSKLQRTDSDVRKFLEAAALTSERPSLGRRVVPNSMSSKVNLSEGTKETCAVRSEGKRRASSVPSTRELLHHSSEVRPAPAKAAPSRSSRVLIPERQDPPSVGRRRDESPTLKSSIPRLFAGTAEAEPKRRLVREVPPSVFRVEERPVKTWQPTQRHPVRNHNQSRIFSNTSGECVHDYKPSAWRRPSSASLQRASTPPRVAPTPDAIAETPRSLGRRTMTSPRPSSPLADRFTSGRKTYENQRNSSTLSIA